MRRLHCIPILILAVAAAWTVPACCDDSDGEETFVVIKAGRVITLAGEEIRNGQIVVVDGKVRLVGKDLDYPKSAEVIDARGETVMPGWIHPRTRRELLSYSRSGVHGDRSVEQEIYLGEIDFEPLLQAGFTAACFYPAGSGIPGSSVVYRTAGPADQRKLGPAYMRVTMSSPGRDKNTLRGAVDKARKEIEKVEKARKDWEEKQKKAKEEAAKKKPEEKGDKPDAQKKETDEKDGEKAATEKKPEEKTSEDEKKPETFTPPKIDPAVKPLVDWIRDKKGPPLLFELSKASDLHHLDDALQRADELRDSLLYLTAGSSSNYHHVVDDLAERKALVLTTPRIGNLPYTVVRYNLPAEISLAGCTVALMPASDSDSELKRLRMQLADLVRAGLPHDEALRAVTLNPAKVLGMDDRLGTIEKGKEADLVFFDGDPLAVGTRITRVVTCGEIVWEAK